MIIETKAFYFSTVFPLLYREYLLKHFLLAPYVRKTKELTQTRLQCGCDKFLTMSLAYVP